MINLTECRRKLPLPELMSRLNCAPDPAPKNPNKFTCRVPWREDSKPSLDVDLKNGIHVWFDRGRDEGGDEVDFIVAVADLGKKAAIERWGELAGVSGSPSKLKPWNRPIAATYDYKDATGKLVFQVVKFSDEKDYSQRRPIGENRWKWNLSGVTRVLYRLPELLEADKDAPVFVVEGEKDADNLRGIGAVATCNSGGAGKWTREDSESLRGRRVIVIPDNDSAGQRHLRTVSKSLSDVAASVEAVELQIIWRECPENGDVSDWLETSPEFPLELLLDAAAPVSDETPTCEPDKPYDARFADSDLGAALLFQSYFGENVRFIHSQKRWLIWDDKRWVPDANGEIGRIANKMPNLLYELAAKSTNDDERAKCSNWAKRLCGNARSTQMLEMVKRLEGIATTAENLDADPWLLNCGNGVLDLRSGELIPHNRDLLQTNIAGADYDPDATAPHWDSFLETIFAGDKDLIRLVQQWLGYCLTGLVTEQTLVFFYGTGRNGKSTLIEAVQNVVRGYGQAAPPSLIAMSHRGADAPSNDVIRLRGIRLAVANETEANTRLAEAKIKQLTGGDTLTAKAHYQEYTDFKPTHKLVISGNHKPVIEGTDEGMWRRIHMIPFSVKIPKEEVNRHLLSTLCSEADGILAWMVRGCLAWKAAGRFTIPSAVTRATATYRSDEDIVGQFLEARCDTADGSLADRAELYLAYCEWCVGEGIRRPKSKGQFNKHLEERGFFLKKSNGRRGWVGMRIKSNQG